MIANLDESAAHYLKVSEQRDGSSRSPHAGRSRPRATRRATSTAAPARSPISPPRGAGRTPQITVTDLPAPFASRAVRQSADARAGGPGGGCRRRCPATRSRSTAVGFDNPRLNPHRAQRRPVRRERAIPAASKVLRGRGARRPRANGVDLRHRFEPAVSASRFSPPGPNPDWVYVCNTDSIVRFPYKTGDLEARGAAETSSRACRPAASLAAAVTGAATSRYSPDGRKFLHRRRSR